MEQTDPQMNLNGSRFRFTNKSFKASILLSIEDSLEIHFIRHGVEINGSSFFVYNLIYPNEYRISGISCSFLQCEFQILVLPLVVDIHFLKIHPLFACCQYVLYPVSTSTLFRFHCASLTFTGKVPMTCSIPD